MNTTPSSVLRKLNRAPVITGALLLIAIILNVFGQTNPLVPLLGLGLFLVTLGTRGFVTGV